MVGQMTELTKLDGTAANKLTKTKDKSARLSHTLKRQG